MIADGKKVGSSTRSNALEKDRFRAQPPATAARLLHGWRNDGNPGFKKNYAFTIVGLLGVAAMSGLNASRFPKYYATMGDILSNLVQGITPLAATIAAVALCVGMAAVLTKFVLFPFSSSYRSRWAARTRPTP